MFTTQAIPFLFGVSILLATPVEARSPQCGNVVRWEAVSGLRPDQVSTPWELTDTASPEDPLLGATALTLSTSEFTETMSYFLYPPNLKLCDPLVVEARLRVVSGSGSAPAKVPADIDFTVSPTFGNGLHLGLGEIFLLQENNVRGPSAAVDTQGAFHTYRIEADFAGNIAVYYDGALTLTGTAFSNASANGLEPRIGWGMGSRFSQGTAEWEYVEHNAGRRPSIRRSALPIPRLLEEYMPFRSVGRDIFQRLAAREWARRRRSVEAELGRPRS